MYISRCWYLKCYRYWLYFFFPLQCFFFHVAIWPVTFYKQTFFGNSLKVIYFLNQTRGVAVGKYAAKLNPLFRKCVGRFRSCGNMFFFSRSQQSNFNSWQEGRISPILAIRVHSKNCMLTRSIFPCTSTLAMQFFILWNCISVWYNVHSHLRFVIFEQSRRIRCAVTFQINGIVHIYFFLNQYYEEFALWACVRVGGLVLEWGGYLARWRKGWRRRLGREGRAHP